jgi:cytochrome c oxidase cbb3-type subunit 4
VTVEINTLRAWVTVLTFLVFIGIVIWAWSRRNQAAFEEAAQLPFGQDD